MPSTRSTRATSSVSPACASPATERPADVPSTAPAKSSTTSDSGSRSEAAGRNEDSAVSSMSTTVSSGSDDAGTDRIAPPDCSVSPRFPPVLPRTDSRPASTSRCTLPWRRSAVPNVREGATGSAACSTVSPVPAAGASWGSGARKSRMSKPASRWSIAMEPAPRSLRRRRPRSATSRAAAARADPAPRESSGGTASAATPPPVARSGPARSGSARAAPQGETPSCPEGVRFPLEQVP